MITNRKIAVIGGGPAGLILARLLQLQGVHAKVYERDFNAAARVQGSPLDMHQGSGWEALRKADLIDEFKKNVHNGANRKIIVNEHAEIIFSDHNSPPAKDHVYESAAPEIDRGTLRKIMLNSLQPDTVVWDSQFVSMKPQHEGWLLHFKNGSSVYADLVIAADGAHSRVRPYITSIKAFYTGITMLELNISRAAVVAPNIFTLLNGGKILAFGKEKNILGGQKESGGLGFYLSFKCEQDWAANSGLDFSDKTQLLAWFKNKYSDWGSIWYELLENASMPVIPRPIFCTPLDQTWDTMPNLTLLGDAAHVMPPFAGEGANTAMFDALELSECLTSGQFQTLEDAIANYEVSMRKRAALAAKQSLENGERMHNVNALQKMIQLFKA